MNPERFHGYSIALCLVGALAFVIYRSCAGATEYEKCIEAGKGHDVCRDLVAPKSNPVERFR
jgi:hypothetical protein